LFLYYLLLLQLSIIAATILVDGTGFSGDIPLLPENLVNFNIADAFYTGGFNDDSFALLSELNFLNVDGNTFNTSIPSVLSELPNLEFLYMSDNYLVGDLSPLEGMPAIRELWMDANPELVGPLFSWMGSMTTLESLSISYSNLTGQIPAEFGNLTLMKQMWLQLNNLTGTIPTELGLMKKLETLELESNSFTGFVHASICVNTEFPTQTLKKVGADCYDENFFCPCCTCCDLDECVTGVSTRRETRKRRKLNLRRRL
jgi:Leucine-rich repeat (LRR) protein